MSEVWGYEALFKAKYLGNSAGAMMSFLILSEKNIKIWIIIFNFFKRYRKKRNFGNVSNYINDVLNHLINKMIIKNIIIDYILD